MSDATCSASGGVPLLRIWLSILGIFLLLSSFAFAFPDEQVERLLAFSRSQENQRPCPLCAPRMRRSQSRAVAAVLVPEPVRG